MTKKKPSKIHFRSLRTLGGKRKEMAKRQRKMWEKRREGGSSIIKFRSSKKSFQHRPLWKRDTPGSLRALGGQSTRLVQKREKELEERKRGPGGSCLEKNQK